MRRIRHLALPLALALLSSAAAGADYRTEVIAEGLEYPWALAFLPDGGYLVTERVGRLRRIAPDGQLSEPIAGLPDIFVKSQGGLMGLLLARDFETSGTLFLSYATGTAESNSTRLARARLIDGALRELEVIFTAEPNRDRPVHYGGRMDWLPDGSLLLTLGDGFDLREQAQNPANHIGTIVRLLPDGTPPADNPFVDSVAARSEIFSYGHRNPQGIVVDPISGTIWSHEHGPRGGDEINRLIAGENYGWPIATEGIDYSGARISPFESRPGLRDPEWVWTPSIAPAGLAIYRGDEFPDWNGDLLVASLAERSLRRVDLDGSEVVGDLRVDLDIDERLRDVRVSPSGGIFLLTDREDGQLLRLRRADDPGLAD
jgi:glucose/arabinose dehydrogenase